MGGHLAIPGCRYNLASVLRSNRLLLGSLIVVGSLVGGLVFLFGIDRASNGAEILGDVTVNGVQLGGLSEFEAIERVRAMEQDLVDRPIPVVIAGRTFDLNPILIDFDIDEQAIVQAALDNGREGNIFGQFGWWLAHFSDDDASLEIPYDYDISALEEIIAD